MYAQYRHFRKDINPERFNQFLQEIDLVNGSIVPNGCKAVTECTLFPDENEDVPRVTGTAFCGRNDQFSKKRGRVIAQGRALRKLETGNLDVEQTD